MAAAKGNQYAAKERRWGGMIQRVLERGDGNQLERIAQKVLALAEEGEQWAVTEIANRLDGKPVQQVNVEGSLQQPQTLTDAFLAYVAQGGRPDEYSKDKGTEH